MKKYFLTPLLFLVATLLSAHAYSQENIAIKTNLLYGAGAFTPNLGVEVGIGNRTTLDLSGGYNWFNLDGSKNNNQKLVHWIVQPEFRYFLDERFNGHFFGVHALYSQYNIGGYKLPMLFGKDSKAFRHEGNAVGGGFSYGYQLPLAKQWKVEFNLGLGYMRMKYDQYDCVNCGKLREPNKVKNYFGPTKAGVSIIFQIQ
jgi:hypothetical protein